MILLSGIREQFFGDKQHNRCYVLGFLHKLFPKLKHTLVVLNPIPMNYFRLYDWVYRRVQNIASSGDFHWACWIWCFRNSKDHPDVLDSAVSRELLIREDFVAPVGSAVRNIRASSKGHSRSYDHSIRTVFSFHWFLLAYRISTWIREWKVIWSDRSVYPRFQSFLKVIW